MNKMILSLACTLAITVLTGCSGKEYQSQQVVFTPEEKARMIAALKMKMRSAFSEGSQENAQNEQTTRFSQNIQSKTLQMSESQLLQKLKSLPDSKKGIKFTRREDGFDIDGNRRYIDPEGEISNYGYNWKNGRFCYAVKTADTRYKIKCNSVDNPDEPVEIANVSRHGNRYTVSTATGKTFSGKGLILTSKGFIVVRDGTAFTYEAGKGTKTFVAPKGWHIAAFQNGDVASTNFILLERNQKPKSSSSLNPFSDLIESTKELGNALGISKKDDYMLISMQDPGKKYPLNITLGEKDVALYSECRQSGRYFQKCDQMDMKESLYNTNGLKNFNHYFWNVTWFSGKNRPFAVTKESNNRNVNVIDLDTGKRVTVANRMTGFPEFDATQDSDGRVKVHVAGGFLPSVDIDDAEARINHDKTAMIAK